MKTKFLYLLLSAFIFISCQKEYSVETNTSTTATFTFDGSPTSCLVAVAQGSYKTAVALDASNVVTIGVNVTKLGTYSITTNLVNGIKFSGTGTFSALGSQNIDLTGTGTPVAQGSFDFTTAVTGCTFTINVTSAAPSAVFTYAGAPGNCTGPLVNGVYTSGTALGTTNTVDLTVTVTTAGAYSVVTNTANGVSFRGSGTLNTGTQTLLLTGQGTPATAGTFNFTPTNNGCAFPINVTAAGNTSIYTLDCSTPVISGTYTVGVPLGAGNTITIKANVTTAGTYSISTPATNGMTFSASGSFAVGAGQNIVLKGSGIPVAAGNNNFTVGSGCSFSITTVAPPPAVYTFTCNGTNVSGSYVISTALTTSNKVDVEVNVTTAGAYTITSNTVNGMTFSKTGVFTGTGIVMITLTGSGIPVTAGVNNFTVGGAAACPFSVTVTALTSPCSGLVDGKFVMTGQFTLNGFSFGVSLGTGQYQVTIQDGFVQLDVFFPGNNPPRPGIYSIGTVTIHCLHSTFIDWNAQSGSVYVTVDGSGNTAVEFCNVNFRGVPLTGGAAINATGAGKMVF
jgi:hypothetical protein